MEGRSDGDKIPTIVQQRGWKDPRGTIAPDLENAAELVRNWEMRHEIIGQSFSGNLEYGEGDTVEADL
ncbi:hypothetical protein [Streptomyces sp. NPDC059466]|uniref:hypothetical protein n=1 Tax=unclassified Streptomyces TaxID=2593676 RepID=UPI0036B40E14